MTELSSEERGIIFRALEHYQYFISRDSGTMMSKIEAILDRLKKGELIWKI